MDLLARVQTAKQDADLFPFRPDRHVKRAWNAVPLWANYFELNFHNPDLVLYLYEMTFEAFPSNEFPEKEVTVPEGKKLMQVVRCALSTSTFEDTKHEVATDFGRMLISCKKLEDKQKQTGKFKFWAENEQGIEGSKPRKNAMRFQMTLHDKGQLRLADLTNYLRPGTHSQGTYESILPIVQALDVILGHYGKFSSKIATPKQGKCFPLEPEGSNKFRIEGPKHFQGYLQGVRGFFASVRATTDRTLVNCNACCGAFYKPGPLEDLFGMFVAKDGNSPVNNVKRLEKAIQGIRVELTHLDGNPIRTIFGLAHPFGGPKEVEFYHERDERNYTVQEHWQKKFYKSIRNLTYPVVNVGNRSHPNFVPPQVCKIIPGQMAKRKLDAVQTSDMIEQARREPEMTRNSINADAFVVLGLKNNDTLKSFEISLRSDMFTVAGRLLERPAIIYNEGSKPREIDNQARWNLKGGARVNKAGQLEKWAILRIIRDEKGRTNEESIFKETFQKFIDTLKATLGGHNVSEPIDSWLNVVKKGQEKDALKQDFLRCRTRNIRFLVIVLPDNDADTYKQIKRFGDVDHGINTVCVLGDSTKKRFYKKPVDKAVQYFANVALKINLKLEGTNHILRNQRPLYKNTMVIGIDVTHPSPGPTKRTAPSVAAMVVSVDDQLAQWPVDLRINTAGKEMVDLLGPMLTTRLELWKSKHGESLPDNLLIYRDGVSEGQYKAVLDEELGQIRNTCKVMYGGRELPKITLIIVGKRHHTRFFKKMGKEGEEYCTNPDFGTVVDTGVTEARNWDFFLQSHHALLGTARPAHYFVLCNEIFTKESVDPNEKISEHLHKLTYEMCYVFGRCTGPVSIPPPVYYADLACKRSRCYDDFEDDVSDTSSMVGDDRGDGYGSQVPYRPAPSKPGPSKSNPNKPGSSSMAAGKKEDASKKNLRPTAGVMPDLTAGLTKKEKARLFEERTAAAQKAAQQGSSKAEEKNPEAKGSSKAEGKKPEAKGSSKAEEKKPEAKGSSKAEGKKPEAKGGEKMSEGKATGKVKEGEAEQGKAQGKKPEEKVEVEKPKEKAQVEIHEDLQNKMFYI